MSNQEPPLQATMRFTTVDLRQTLALIGWDKDGDTDLCFASGLLAVRSENSYGFLRQAPVPVLEGSGPSIGFRVSNEKLRTLVKLDRELRLGVIARDGYSCRVAITDGDAGLVDLNWECQRIPVEDQTHQGKLLPGTLLRELLRVAEPFAFDRRRSCLEPTEHVDLIGMTRHGLVCHSPEDETVCFDAQGLVEPRWAIPVEVLANVRRFTRKWKSYCVSTDDERTRIADGDGALVSWRTPVPVDFGVDADSYEPDLDHLAATVSGKKLRSALGSMVSRLPSSDCSVVLRICPLDRSMAFEITYQGASNYTSVRIHIDRCRLEDEIEPRFSMGSLRKVLGTTKGRSVELRLHRNDGEHRGASWQLRSIDSYSLSVPKNGSGGQPDTQPGPCRVTRTTTSLARGK